MNILELRDVSYTYNRGTPFEELALDSVSVGFEKGKITGIIGHTGSGKSTLTHLLNGLEKPSSGDVLLCGESIWEEPKKIAQIRFRIGLVMQYPEYQLFDETVRADIGFGPRNMGLDEDEIARRVDEAARFAGIAPELMDKSPFDLSGGQKRRAAIAGVLAMRPEILVLEEPAAGLDPRGRTEILGGLRDYQRSRNATILLVSHSMEDMARYCDNIVVMNQGRIYVTGTVSEVFARSEELQSVGLNVPEIARIANGLIRRGIPLSGDLYTVEGVRRAILSYVKGECEC